MEPNNQSTNMGMIEPLPEEEVTVQAGPPVPAGQQAALLHAVVGCRASALAAALAPSVQTV